MSHRIELVPEPAPELRATMLEGLRAFNATELSPGLKLHDLAVAIRDPALGGVVGGLWGRTSWGWLTVELIFVPENLRGQGLATRLITAAEHEAMARGCHAAWLDTLNPKALSLYERLGYTRFGELKDFPVGQCRYFLQKTLEPAISTA
jgi:GNAT superfamily N-acetyltransferase